MFNKIGQQEVSPVHLLTLIAFFAYGYYVGGSRGGSILVSGVSAVGIGGYDTGKQTGN